MTSNSPVPLKIAIATYGHTAALKQGIVPIDGVDAEFVEVKPIIAAFRRMVRDLEFDVCEMAPATYMIARAAGAPFKALPISIFRRFHHDGFVTRSDSGIAEPKDLEGKRAGVRAYSVTTGIWTRGILSDMGVDLSRVTWVVDDEEHVKSLRLPDNVEQAPEGKSLVDLMAEGYLSAAFTANAGIGRAGAPTGDWQVVDGSQGPVYEELFPDGAERAAEWYRSTGVYPLHAVIVVKDSVLEQHPEVARALFDAFVASKAIYLEQLAAGTSDFDKDDHYREMQQVVGPDPLPYGLNEDRASIECLIRYCFEQGLLPEQYAAEDMFINLSN
ncbi:ABC transporter substrate-binding protein [Novosphingobium flavum]|uniref:ABC transporter substrate-binding protein n=1 Tax=Novosphingobium flavum TaxID=1778672 RepID=A0A7X1FNZ9_9SPHN|nr:ABC transporter substrate-binding protein [Novosphingobium flavum]MBC2664238.1 ABC transporter substrate-binding protein [Novosphingobium flavum]